MLFHIIPEAVCILRSRGVYRQANVYRRGDELYAKWGNGFVSLRTRSGTSHPNVSWDHIEGVSWREEAVGPLRILERRKAAA